MQPKKLHEFYMLEDIIESEFIPPSCKIASALNGLCLIDTLLAAKNPNESIHGLDQTLIRL